jgi:hypothetical protein
MKAQILEDKDLVRVFYEIYNGNSTAGSILTDFKAPIIEGEGTQKNIGGQLTK